MAAFSRARPSSITQSRRTLAVRTEDGVIEAHFGPQERVVKEIIDRIYNAKTSFSLRQMSLRIGRWRAHFDTKPGGLQSRAGLGAPSEIPFRALITSESMKISI